MQPILSICIPTVFGREVKFERLLNEINRQIAEDTLQGLVEVIVEKDNKEMSIGNKRDAMYNRCNGLYSVQIDDDDMISQFYCKDVVEACLNGDDCIGYIEKCVINGAESRSLLSCNYADWIEDLRPQEHGCCRVRTPFMKTPILTELCKKTGVKDMRFAEDHDFARRVLPLIKTMTFIPEEMYFYTYEKETTHNERYGIK